VAWVSLGCPKNLIDSEKMLGLLAQDGLLPVSDHSQADAIVINTCGFLEASKAESLREIEQAVARKRSGRCRRVVVAGCLVQRHRAKLLEWCPGVDALVGVFDRDRIVTAVRGCRPAQDDVAADLPVYSSIAASAVLARRARPELSRGSQNRASAPPGSIGYFESDTARLRLTPRHYAYLRISEGCNQNCAFCTIPSIRGKMRSKPVEAILAEARELLADGAFELNLIGQDTTSYGTDLGYHAGLPGLLAALDQAAGAASPGGAWLRLMYAYPSCFTDAMIDALAGLPRVVKYLDIPLQHIHDQVLTAMRRRTSRRLIETLLDKLRRRVPGIAIRTTFISGFPGETPAQHRALLRFIQDFGFDAMGVFPFSPEPATVAGTMHARGQAIAPQVIEGRIDQLMRAQQELVFARNARLAQNQAEFDVLIDKGCHWPEAQSSEQPTSVQAGCQTPAPCTPPSSVVPPSLRRRPCYAGRTYQQAPEIDALTYVVSKQKLAPGELIRCRVIAGHGYDLVAQPLTDTDHSSSMPLTILQ
jgi:ribosomal protein S12 methylthiotransferase